MDATWNRRYARLLAGAGLGVSEGARLRVVAEIAHRDLARAAWRGPRARARGP